MDAAEEERSELESVAAFLADGDAHLPHEEGRQKRIRKAAQKHCLIDGVLHRGISDPKRVVVDADERQALIRHVHCGGGGGGGGGGGDLHQQTASSSTPILRHVSLKACVRMLTRRERVYWPRMALDVAEFIRGCPLCTQKGVARRATAAANAMLDTDDEEDVEETAAAAEKENDVWRSVHVSVEGPFLDCKYVFVMVDPFSQWIVARGFELEQEDSADLVVSLARFVFSSLCEYGFARCRVHLPSAEEFEALRNLVAAKADTLESLVKTERTLTAAAFMEHAPSSEPCCDWMSAELRELVESSANEGSCWDMRLDSWLLYQRTLVKSFGRTPFSVIFNRDPLGGICEDPGDRRANRRSLSAIRRRRSLKSRIMSCRHCNDVFTSRISFLIHQRRHIEQAKRVGAMAGEEKPSVAEVEEEAHVHENSEVEDEMNEQPRAKRRKRGGNRRQQNIGGPGRFDPEVRLAQLSCGQGKGKMGRRTAEAFTDASEVNEVKESTISAVKALLDATREARSKRGKYAKFSPEMQDEIAEYALKHGIAATVAHFGGRFEHNTLTASSVRNFVRAHQVHPPALKEEVGRHAYQYGPEKALQCYQKKRPELDLNRTLIRRFKSYFLNRHPNLVDYDVGGSGMNESSDRGEEVDARMAVFGHALRDEIGQYAFQCGNVPAVEHFSAKLQFPMQESTVRKFKKAWMTKNNVEEQVFQQQQQVHEQGQLGGYEMSGAQNFALGVQQQPQDFVGPAQHQQQQHVVYEQTSHGQYTFLQHQDPTASSSLPLSLTMNSMAVEQQEQQLVNLSTSAAASQQQTFEIIQTDQGPVPVIVQQQDRGVALDEQPGTTLTVTLPPGAAAAPVVGEEVDLTNAEILVEAPPNKEEGDHDEQREDEVETKVSSRGRPVRRKIVKSAGARAKKAASAASKKQVAHSKGKTKRRYSTYDPELRAQVGRYAAEHGNQETIEHFRETAGVELPESTVRGLRDRYLVKVSAATAKKDADANSMDYGPRGRPTMLGKYDAVVRDCIRQLTESGEEQVSSFLAIATAKQVLAQREPELLAENGGSIELNMTWAKSFLRRNKFKVRAVGSKKQ